jgi:hypothetical protein
MNVAMDFVVAGVSGQASMHYAFPWQRKSVGMFSLWPRLSYLRILNSGFGSFHAGSASTSPQDFARPTRQADERSRHEPIQDPKERGLNNKPNENPPPRPFPSGFISAMRDLSMPTWRFLLSAELASFCRETQNPLLGGRFSVFGPMKLAF